MKKEKMTEEEFVAGWNEIEAELENAKKSQEEMSYREKMEAYTKFIRLYNVKKMPEDTNNG